MNNISAESIKSKIKKEANESKKDFNFLLLHYFIERLLYRLSISPYANNFILKGGLLLYYTFDGSTIAEAISQTFRNRKTEFSPQPMIFNDDFSLLPNKQVQWRAFIRRTNLENVPADFSEVVLSIKKFLFPVYEALDKKIEFTGCWKNETAMWCFQNEK